MASGKVQHCQAAAVPYGIPKGGGAEMLVGLEAGTIPGDWSWNQYLGKFGGSVLSGGIETGTEFRPGTAYLKPVILANQHGEVGNFIRWRNVSLTQVLSATLVEELKIAEEDLSNVTAEDQRIALPLGNYGSHLWPESVVKVDTEELYTISGRATLTVDEIENPLKFASLDVDQKLIHPLHVSKYGFAADTSLAADLNPGDTSFLISNASGWSNTEWESAQTRALAWYGYTDTTGHTYEDYSYTRNVAFDFDHGLWDVGGISFDVSVAAYRVVLQEPWSGPALGAGTAVRNAAGGDVFQVPNSYAMPTGVAEEVDFEVTVGGSTWFDGQRSETTFRPGTVYIQPVIEQPLPAIGLTIGPEQDIQDHGPLYFPQATVDIAADGQFSLDLDVLAKDAFGIGETFSLEVVWPVEHGTATIVAGPDGHDIIRYQSPIEFAGTEVIVYSLRNLGTDEIVHSTVTVTVVDQAETVMQYRMLQLGLAMGNYGSTFPIEDNDSYFDASGNPYLSWRVHLLRAMGYFSLYDQFNLDEPWNSANNLPLLAQMPEEFRSIRDAEDSTTTRIQTFTGPDAPFGRLPAGENQVGPRRSHFLDGQSHTILFAEMGSDTAVPWTMPADRSFDISDPLAALGTITDDKINVVMADLSTKTFSAGISAADLSALVTLDGDETVDAGKLQREYLQSQSESAAENFYAANDLRRIRELVLGMHQYANIRSRFPGAPFGDPSYFDENGKPLLSWACLLIALYWSQEFVRSICAYGALG